MVMYLEFVFSDVFVVNVNFVFWIEMNNCGDLFYFELLGIELLDFFCVGECFVEV